MGTETKKPAEAKACAAIASAVCPFRCLKFTQVAARSLCHLTLQTRFIRINRSDCKKIYITILCRNRVFMVCGSEYFPISPLVDARPWVFPRGDDLSTHLA